MPATEQSILDAAEGAEGYWRNARQFDLIGSHLGYKAASDTECLQPGMNCLRNGGVITIFTVRRAVSSPVVLPGGNGEKRRADEKQES